MSLEKLLSFAVAAQLTAAAMPQATGLPVDPELKEAATRARNLQTWETFRVYQTFVSQALAADNWPTPALPAGGKPLAGLLAELIGKIPGLPAAAAPIVGQAGPLKV